MSQEQELTQTGSSQKIADLLFLPDMPDVEWEIPCLDDLAQAADRS